MEATVKPLLLAFFAISSIACGGGYSSTSTGGHGVNPFPAPSITTTSVPDGMVGVEYHEVVAAMGLAPFGWTVSAGVLPPGLELTPIDSSVSIAIAGTPTTAGVYDFTITVSEDATQPRTGHRAFRITIT